MMPSNIDTMEMIRQIREEQYEETKHMTAQEKIDHYHLQAQKLMAQLKKQVEERKQQRVTA